MALSDCIHCWETPCSCGWEYIDWKDSRLNEHIQLLTKLQVLKIEHPKASKDEICKLLWKE